MLRAMRLQTRTTCTRDSMTENGLHSFIRKRKGLGRVLRHLAISLLGLSCLGTESSMALSSPIEWSKPVNLSDTRPLSTHPAIVSDDYGNVHVFWSEELGGRARLEGDLGGSGNSIFYTRWDGSAWTPAVDILSVPGEPIAEFVAVDIGPDDEIHAVWTGQENFYYSNAPLWEADSAHAWREPLVVASNSARSRLESNIAVDKAGDIHIIYATGDPEPGIHYIHSQDRGETWSLDSVISKPFDPLERSYSTVQIIVDDAGTLHAIWLTSQQEGRGQAIYYTRSIGQGQSWNTPIQLAYRGQADMWVDWPYLMSEGDSVLHLVYVYGTNVGRAYRTSVDGGENWSDPYQFITEMEGVNGYVIPLVDSLGRMHLIVNMRTRDSQTVGIYYAQRLDNSWSPIVPLDVAGPAAPSAHYAAATMRLGSEIHVVYNQISIGEIWYLRGILPDITPRPTLVQSPNPTAPEAGATADAIATPEATMPIGPSEQPPLGSSPASPNVSSTSFAILPGLGLALVLVAAVIVWTRVRAR